MLFNVNKLTPQQLYTLVQLWHRLR